MYSGRQMAAVVAAAVLMTTGVWPQPPTKPPEPRITQIERADFDANGRIDLDDLALLRKAVGSTEARFDLDGSGRVDVGDLFRFAESVEGPLPFEPRDRPHDYTLRITRQQLILSMPDYTVRIRHGTPFGISSLRRRGQRTDFAHQDLPLADWEWLRFHSPVLGKRQQKLMEMDWGAPEVHELSDRLEVIYRLPVSRIGVEAEVRYSFLAQGSSFHVTYSLINGSRWPLDELYVMLGLPGFTNHGYVTAVASARERRLPFWPARVFLAEAQALKVPEYQLLRHDVRAGVSEGLKGSVRLQDGDDDYRLSSYYLTDPSLSSAYSAHTNKPRYLTSHLYLTLGDLKPMQRRSITIHHVLSGP